jgi:hypothetical protein
MVRRHALRITGLKILWTPGSWACICTRSLVRPAGLRRSRRLAFIVAKNDPSFQWVILLGQAGKDIWAGKIPAIDVRDEC